MVASFCIKIFGCLPKYITHHKYGYEQKPRRAFKGVWIPAEIWLYKGLKPMEKLILIEIHSLDGEKGCWASNSHFEELFEISNRHVQRIIEQLKALGFIEVQVDKMAGNHRVINVKTLTPEPLPSRHTGREGNDMQVVRSRPTGRKVTTHTSPPSKSSVIIPFNNSVQFKEETNPNEPFKNLEELLNKKSERTFTPGGGAHPEAKENLLFVERFPDPSVFAAEMLELFPAFSQVNFNHYYKKAADWSNKKNLTRFDWIGTVKDFILNDEKEGKVKLNEKIKVPHAIKPKQPKQHFNEFITAYDNLTSGSFEEFTLRLDLVAREFSNAITSNAITIEGDNSREALLWQKLNEGTIETKKAYFEKHQNEMLV
jgi:Helix-turn-helix domain